MKHSTIIFNGKKSTLKDISKIFSKDFKELLIQNGGLIARAMFYEQTLFIGIAPQWANNEKILHHSIILPNNPTHTWSMVFNPNLSCGLFPVPHREIRLSFENLTSELISLGDFFIAIGFTPTFLFDPVCFDTIAALGFSDNVPKNLEELIKKDN